MADTEPFRGRPNMLIFRRDRRGSAYISKGDSGEEASPSPTLFRALPQLSNYGEASPSPRPDRRESVLPLQRPSEQDLVRLLDGTRLSQPYGRLAPLSREIASDPGYREDVCRVYPNFVEVDGRRYVPASDSNSPRGDPETRVGAGRGRKNKHRRRRSKSRRRSK